MNPAYDEVLAAPAEARAGLFTTTAQRIGTAPQNVEKDFFVCWVLDALFNGLPSGPRLLFKGGTSLSKGFGLINRFSEDVDVTVFRDDLGEGYSVEDLDQLSRKKRKSALDDIKAACEKYINGDLLDHLCAVIAEAAGNAGIPRQDFDVRSDPSESQTLLVRYPSATASDPYIEKIVRIKSGAKSALDPHSVSAIAPYVDDDFPGLESRYPTSP